MRRAFTLLEVLIALAVFALAAVGLGAAYLNVLNTYALIEQSAKRDDEVTFARAALHAEPEREKAEEGGEFTSTDNRRVRWSATIEPTNVADLFTVTFTCEVDDPLQAKPQVIKETYRLLRPTWSDPAEREKLRAEARDRILELQGKLK